MLRIGPNFSWKILFYLTMTALAIRHFLKCNKVLLAQSGLEFHNFMGKAT